MAEAPLDSGTKCIKVQEPLRRPDAEYFLLEALNSAGAIYYNYYIFFFLQRHFGFGNAQNLTFSAVNGLIYIFAAWYGGKFAQKAGNLAALLAGLVVVITSLLVASGWETVTGQVAMMICWTVGICFTWPALEAQISDNRPRRTLPRMIGMYNVVWAATGALTYFWGGAVFERFGEKSLFFLPAAIHLLELGLVVWLWRRFAGGVARNSSTQPAAQDVEEDRPVSEPEAQSFLRTAWVANPFAYIAINTIIPVIPEIARKLDLSPTVAGFLCSIWFFVRLGTFWFLWQWTAWHYRFGPLLGAFVGLVASFGAMLLVRGLGILIVGQVVFGFCVGLIYYSSLFYSMDVGDTKGEHGGVHEAAIGLGICVGPAVGAAALRIVPEKPTSAGWAVTGLLVMGLLCLVGMRRNFAGRKVVK